METMEQKSRTRRSCSEEYKGKVVELCRACDKSLSEVCRISTSCRRR